MSEYGLPDVRDSSGERKAVDHTFEWGDDEVMIRLLPPTIAEFEEFEAMGVDTDASELSRVLDEHLIKPDVKDDWTMSELLCYLNGIVDYAENGGGQLADEVRSELEERAGEGN